ncbi:winged helix-turn-helix domain-containing protein [Micromonospora haikouensis]|uniref:winged helix-turn-helix domain-containing protein n=1 Tax=Micromonospora haikouensis TaxID=686309 RepID=UPI0034466B1C
MATAERILALLTRHPDDPPTAGELADWLRVTPSTVTSALRRLAAAGKVRQAGEAFNGAKTWTTTGEK